MWESLQPVSVNQSQLTNQILTLEIHNFKPWRYISECNNQYKLWKSIKLGMFLIL